MNINILISGDVINTRSDNSFISDELQAVISAQDYAVCNFEAPIGGLGTKAIKAGPNIYQKIETIQILKNSGFDLLLLANNHIYDYGESGLAGTIDAISHSNLSTIGAGLNEEEIYKPLFKDINGITIGFINACEAQFGVFDGSDSSQKSGYAWINHSLIEDTIRSTRLIADKVLVFVHAGLEEYSIPLNEWKDRYRRLCDVGADCIIGSHPHVPQGYELYNGKLIFYSLGNFYMDTASYENTPDHSFSVILKLSKLKNEFSLVSHHKENGMVRITKKNEEVINIDHLNEVMNDKILSKQVYLDAYERITSKYYANVFNSVQFSTSTKQLIKNVLKKILFSKTYKNRGQILLLHLIRNETYRWVTQRAIELKQYSKQEL